MDICKFAKRLRKTTGRRLSAALVEQVAVLGTKGKSSPFVDLQKGRRLMCAPVYIILKCIN